MFVFHHLITTNTCMINIQIQILCNIYGFEEKKMCYNFDTP